MTYKWEQTSVIERFRSVEQIIRDIQEVRLYPLPDMPGCYGTREGYDEHGGSYISNWVHFPSRVEMVLKGEHFNVKPCFTEFVPSLLCPFRCPHCTYRQWKERLGVWEINRVFLATLMSCLQ